ncbi:hypothetical protein RU639_007861 [Aspergillus parasiticus]|uniref:Uncharacterized protein n=1 Tax=Aspergillus transmontanensis TaxID=1034304 RepID=A0A5N6VF59_9EURO|nr:hypothetical protein BDV41DRAFT_93026 [Aspergillus transmontanensis]
MEDVALRPFRLGVLSHQLLVLADPLLATAELLGASPSLFPSPLCSFFFTNEALFQPETLLPSFLFTFAYLPRGPGYEIPRLYCCFVLNSERCKRSRS